MSPESPQRNNAASDSQQRRNDRIGEIYNRYWASLCKQVQSILAPQVKQRVGVSDIVQIAMHEVLGRSSVDIDNCNEIRKHLVRTVVCRALNANRNQKRRGALLHVDRFQKNNDGSQSEIDLLDFGRPPQAKEKKRDRDYNREVDYSSAAADENADSFFDDRMIDVMVYGVQPEDASIARELMDMLDSLPGKLPQVFRLDIMGYSRSEIASKIDRSTKTVTRYLATIKELLNTAYPIEIRVEHNASPNSQQQVYVFPGLTVDSILRRIDAGGCELHNPAGKIFDRNDELFGKVDPNSQLTAKPATPSS